jgi:hypothetical protein
MTQLLCIVALLQGSATCMIVRPPSPEASESEHGGVSTGVPEWQLLERVEEVAVEQIHLL